MKIDRAEGKKRKWKAFEQFDVLALGCLFLLEPLLVPHTQTMPLLHHQQTLASATLSEERLGI